MSEDNNHVAPSTEKLTDMLKIWNRGTNFSSGTRRFLVNLTQNYR